MPGPETKGNIESTADSLANTMDQATPSKPNITRSLAPPRYGFEVAS